MRIGVLGDVHGQLDAADVAALDARGLDLVCAVGDLGGALHRDTLAVARVLATLRTPALLLPGNHDGTSPLGVLAESVGLAWRPGSGLRGARRADRLRRALGPVSLAGFSLHPFPDHGITVLGARPYAMDPRRASFSGALGARFGVRTLADATTRLCALVDAADHDLVVLAHNGPRGLGAGADAPFALRGRDWGDPDLAAALARAEARGRRVRAVLAGHLHHRGERLTHGVAHGVTWVNAARVPRWTPEGRHHVEVTIGPDAVEVEEIVLPSPRDRW